MAASGKARAGDTRVIRKLDRPGRVAPVPTAASATLGKAGWASGVLVAAGAASLAPHDQNHG